MAHLATPSDNELLESIMMHPEVRKWNACNGTPPFNPARYTAHPKSFAVLVDGGCFLAAALEKEAYAVHTNLLPTCRGRKAVEVGAEALNFAFLETDATQLVSMVPDNNPQARWFALRMGFRETFRREGVWRVDGRAYGMQFFRMDIDDWVLLGGLAHVGQAFHAELHAQAPWLDEHPEDPVHDAYVGACSAMISLGKIDKSLTLYNRWARAAGYAPFTVISRDPLRLDIASCVLRIDDNNFIVEVKNA